MHASAVGTLTADSSRGRARVASRFPILPAYHVGFWVPVEPVTLARDMAVADRTQAVNPPLKWAGGKRWQVPHLSLFGDRAPSGVVEPFSGGLAVALGLLPGRAMLNDANVHVINFYRWLQRGCVSIALWKS